MFVGAAFYLTIALTTQYDVVHLWVQPIPLVASCYNWLMLWFDTWVP